jgi:glycosyltransferase involved in cell wall biosynthesis
MRIVHFLPPLTKGGAERMAVDLANHAARNGHDVTIVASYPVAPELLADAISPNVEVRYVTKRPSRLAKYLALGPWLAANRDWLLSRDVIHCHLTYGAIAGSGIKMTRRGRRPIIVETFHAVGMPIPSWKRELAAMLASGRDGFVLMAEDDYWRQFRAMHPKLPVRIIPNGVAPPKRLPTKAEVDDYRAAVGIPKGVRVVGTVGRLVEGRMPTKMVEVFAAIDRRGRSDVHFFMGGEGDLAETTRQHAKALGLGERVHLPGLVKKPFTAIGLIDLYVSINVGAITGIAGLEAAACSKPVIALQTREDYSQAKDDWIWSSPDPAEVAAEAARLLDDPEARKRLGAAQAERVRAEHSDAAMSAAYEKFYAEMLEP